VGRFDTSALEIKLILQDPEGSSSTLRFPNHGVDSVRTSVRHLLLL
jgi:hypothetical protein